VIYFDGTASYSETRAVLGIGGNTFKAAVFPNPVKDVLKVRFAELAESVKSAEFRIMGINGQILQSFSLLIQSYQLIALENMDQLVPASYILEVKLDNDVFNISSTFLRSKRVDYFY
jgi:hypothetical protein